MESGYDEASQSVCTEANEYEGEHVDYVVAGVRDAGCGALPWISWRIHELPFGIGEALLDGRAERAVDESPEEAENENKQETGHTELPCAWQCKQCASDDSSSDAKQGDTAGSAIGHGFEIDQVQHLAAAEHADF